MSATAQLLLSCAGLFVLAALPLCLVWLLAAFSRTPATPTTLIVGNSMLLSDDTPDEPPMLTPLAHLVRTAEEPMLRHLMLGLRFFPIELAEPILKRYRSTGDAELQIYSQSVRQEAMQSLQTTYLQLKAKATNPSPAWTASYLSAGLRLLDAPFTPDTEHATLLAELERVARTVLDSRETLPRLIFEAGRVLTRCGKLDDAQAIFNRLPDASPLEKRAQKLLTYRRTLDRASHRPQRCQVESKNSLEISAPSPL